MTSRAEMAMIALGARNYHRAHAPVIEDVLDQVLDVMRAESTAPKDELFASLVTSFHGDPERAVTVAAVAVMRLLERES